MSTVVGSISSGSATGVARFSSAIARATPGYDAVLCSSSLQCHGVDRFQTCPRCDPPDMTLQGVPGATAEWQSVGTRLAALAQRDQDLEAERRELQRMLREREREQEAVRLKAAYMAGQWQQYSAGEGVATVEQSLAAARSRGLLGGVSGPTTPGDYATVSHGIDPHYAVLCASRM